MVQNAENPEQGDQSWDIEAEGFAVQAGLDDSIDGVSTHLDSSNKVGIQLDRLQPQMLTEAENSHLDYPQ
jgi:hypothetical protein